MRRAMTALGRVMRAIVWRRARAAPRVALAGQGSLLHLLELGLADRAVVEQLLGFGDPLGRVGLGAERPRVPTQLTVIAPASRAADSGSCEGRNTVGCCAQWVMIVSRGET